MWYYVCQGCKTIFGRRGKVDTCPYCHSTRLKASRSKPGASDHWKAGDLRVDAQNEARTQVDGGKGVP